MKIIKRLGSPNGALGLSFIIWFFFFFISPHKYIVEVRGNMIFVISIYIFSFIIGGMIPRISESKRGEINYKKNDGFNSKWINILICLTLIGLLLRYYDLLFNKGYINYSNSSEFRDMYISNNLSGISVISSILFPIALLLLIILFNYSNKITKIQQLLIILENILLVYYSILLGGRTQLTLIFITIFFSIIKYKKEYLKNKKKILIFSAILCGTLFLSYSNKVLKERLQYQKFSSYNALLYLENEHHLQVKDYMWDIINNHEGLDSYVYLFVSLDHYFIHGLYQFQLEVDSFDLNNMTMGAYQFNPIFKLLNTIGIKYNVKDFSSITYEQGVYTTFFGPTYVDFGYWGTLYMFILGYISNNLWIKSQYFQREKILYPLVYSIILHSFFINMIQSGMGLYYILAFIVSLYIIPQFLKGGSLN